MAHASRGTPRRPRGPSGGRRGRRSSRASSASCSWRSRVHVSRSSRLTPPYAARGPSASRRASASASASSASSATTRFTSPSSRAAAGSSRSLSSISSAARRAADQPRQRPARAAVGREADRRVGHREPRRLGREHDVGGDRQAHPAARRGAADGADHGRVERGERLDRGMELRRQPQHRVAHLVALSRIQLEVAADAERLARAGQDHGAESLPRRPSAASASAVVSSRFERVARLGPVKVSAATRSATSTSTGSWLQHHLPGRPATVDQLQRVGRLLEREPRADERPHVAGRDQRLERGARSRRSPPAAGRCRRPSRRRRRRCCSAAAGSRAPRGSSRR